MNNVKHASEIPKMTGKKPWKLSKALIMQLKITSDKLPPKGIVEAVFGWIIDMIFKRICRKIFEVI